GTPFSDVTALEIGKGGAARSLASQAARNVVTSPAPAAESAPTAMETDSRDMVPTLEAATPGEPPWALRDHWAGLTVVRSLGKGTGAQGSRPRAAILVPPEIPVKAIVRGVDFVALDVLFEEKWVTCISLYIPVDNEPAEILERISQEALLSRRSE
ncbi:hypothetical protein FOZ61_004360, partial [Perkinsus olseni]